MGETEMYRRTEEIKCERICSNCNNFRFYYVKSYNKFIKQECGFCRNSDKTVQHAETCEKWKIKTNSSYMSRKLVYKAMRETIKSINTLQCILEEEE